MHPSRWCITGDARAAGSTCRLDELTGDERGRVFDEQSRRYPGFAEYAEKTAGIRTTPERLWEAITDAEIRSKYNFGARVSSDWTPGSRFEMSAPGGRGLLGEGENLEVDPPRRLVQSVVALWSDEVKSEGTSRVIWEIEPVGDSCRLTVTHDGLREGGNEELYGGWPMILSGLKTWLETDELLTTPGSLMYG